MARKLQIQYPAPVYHVMNRGDRREPIFGNDTDRQSFLETLEQACGKTDWQVHAFCLMSNHFHLVVETPQANLSAAMKCFLRAYTGRFNRRHKLFGQLFRGRYRSSELVPKITVGSERERPKPSVSRLLSRSWSD